jgi:hypothetical protein
VAERLGDAARLVGAHQTVGTTLFYQGKIEPALAHYRQGFELFVPDMQFPDWPGSHPAVQCQFFPAAISRMLGYPDRSLEELAAAVRNRRDRRSFCYGIGARSLSPVPAGKGAVSKTSGGVPPIVARFLLVTQCPGFQGGGRAFVPICQSPRYMRSCFLCRRPMGRCS